MDAGLFFLFYGSDGESPVAVGLFAGGRFGVRVAAGVGEGRTTAGVGVATGAVEVFAFDAGSFGVGVVFGVFTGTGHKTNPLGVTEQPEGKSCIKGLCPGGMLTVAPPGAV